jgi:hypothetical protein
MAARHRLRAVDGEDFWDSMAHLVLPVLTVSVIMIAHVSRMVRSETRRRAAQRLYPRRPAEGAGAPRGPAAARAAQRAAADITIVALDVGYLLGGVIVVEEIFALPGIGRQLIVAIQARDLPAIQAGALVMAVTYAVASTLADIAYAFSTGGSSMTDVFRRLLRTPQGAIGSALLLLLALLVPARPRTGAARPRGDRLPQRYRPPERAELAGRRPIWAATY